MNLCWSSVASNINTVRLHNTNEERGLISEETVVLRRWGSETQKFGLSTDVNVSVN